MKIIDNRSRRSFLGSAAAAGIALGTSAEGQETPPAAKTAAPRALVHETRVITPQVEHYCGWPTVARRDNGELVVVWSGGREQHVCPFGRVEFMRSTDDGATWSWPRTVIDGASDDRDAGITVTSQGTLLVTTFTSLAYVSYELTRAIERRDSGDPKAWPAEKLDRWLRVHERLTAEQRQSELGQWMVRSTDVGVTWSARYPTIVNSPHGPVDLADGRLLYAGKQLWTDERRIGVCESIDDGASWQWLAEIPVREGDVMRDYHELHAVETADGRIIVHIRNHNKPNAGETLQTESSDGGKSWSIPHSIGVWGLPSFLNRLADGRLLMTYGHRRQPLGNQARVSSDHGRAWSDPMIISGDGTSSDLGYPSTVELGDGNLLTVWYERMKGQTKAVLRQARWEIV